MKKYIIPALIFALFAICVVRECTAPPPPGGPNYRAKYDSLQVLYFEQELIIEEAQKDSAQAAAKITLLESEVTQAERRTTTIERTYTEKIKSLEGRKMPYYDSLTLERYGEPLTKITPIGAKALYTDVFNGEKAGELVLVLSETIELKDNIIQQKDFVIESDSVRISALGKQLKGKDAEIDLRIKENKLMKKQTRAYQIGFVVAGGLLILQSVTK